ncbi:MAG: SDR family NAD(P)-dependent oxidoreductase [Nevskia sp.]|nr:SDR family NAD(P)-dependent oxidoreductase [Nevskia sp.]
MNTSMNRRGIAVVSGGSSGIGRAFVQRLHGLGYQVLFCGRDERKLRLVEQECPGARGFACDVADQESVLRFAEAVLREFPVVDLLVSNAGHLREIDFTRADLRAADLGEEIRVNLLGAVQLVAAFLPGLRGAARPAIVVISSGYALAPATRAPLYSAAKAGLHSFCKALRRQLAPTGMLVVEVLPPVVDTPSVAHREVAKMPPEQLVSQTLAAVDRRRTEVHPGAVRWLPLLLRLAPGLAERIVARS